MTDYETGYRNGESSTLADVDTLCDHLDIEVGDRHAFEAIRAELGRLRAENERYRAAIKTALDIMATSNDMQLGPGGVARKAYAHLWHEFFAIPAGIAALPREPVGRSEDADSGARRV